MGALHEKAKKNYHTKVEDKEEAFFRQRVGELTSALTAGGLALVHFPAHLEYYLGDRLFLSFTRAP